MLSRPFVIPQPDHPDKKMIVLLVDCEGLQASDSRDGTDQVLFGLSNIMASLLIVNQKGQIGTIDLRNLSILAQFCPPSREKATFCSIELLMRDFKFKSKILDKQLTQMSEFSDKILKSNEESVKYV